jgi:hypothetical protein
LPENVANAAVLIDVQAVGRHFDRACRDPPDPAKAMFGLCQSANAGGSSIKRADARRINGTGSFLILRLV